MKERDFWLSKTFKVHILLKISNDYLITYTILEISVYYWNKKITTPIL